MQHSCLLIKKKKWLNCHYRPLVYQAELSDSVWQECSAWGHSRHNFYRTLDPKKKKKKKKLKPAFNYLSKAKKSPNCSPEKILLPKTICTSSEYLARVQTSVFHILQEKVTLNPRKVRNETQFHWLTKPNLKWKYNDLRKSTLDPRTNHLAEKARPNCFGELVCVN